MTLTGHRGEVNAVIFSPDGRQLVSGGEDGTIRFWDPVAGTELFCLKAHGNCVNTLAYSPDGQVLASGSCDGTIRTWHATTHQLLATLEGHTDRVDFVAFSPIDGNRLASGGHDPIARIWDLTSGRVVQSLDTKRDTVYALTWRPDGQVLFIGGSHVAFNGTPLDKVGSSVMAWDVAADVEIDAAPGKDFQPGTMALGMSHSGDRLCIGVGSGVFELMHTKPQPQLSILPGHVSFIQAVAYSRDDDLLASGSFDTTIRIWDTARGTCEQVLTAH